MNLTVAIVCMLAAAQVSQEAGQVVGTFGSVIIQRGEEAITASAGTQLLAKDRLIAVEDSGAMILTRPQASLYLGASSRIALMTVEEPDWVVLNLDSGEVRITPSAGRSAMVMTVLATGGCDGPGTLRCRAERDVVRYWAERGSSVIKLTEEGVAAKSSQTWLLVRHLQGDDKKALVLPEGKSVEIRRGEGFGDVQDADPDQWDIDPTEFAIAIASGSGSRLQRGAETDPDTPNPVTPQDPSTPSSSSLNSQVAVTGGINITLGTSIGSAAAGSSGGAFADANQGTLSGTLQSGFGSITAGSAFPGNIHLVTGETSYTFSDIRLTTGDEFPTMPEFWSIGMGPVPQGQIVTDILTGTAVVNNNPQPTAISIPLFDAYIVRLDQFESPDPAQGGASANVFGVTGLVGNQPVSPGVTGATPLADERAVINRTATFALGEFAVRRDGEAPVIAMRRSDQDRRIVKDPGGDDNKDQVTVNPDVAQFNTTVDPRFFAPDRAVFVPARNSLRNLPRYSREALIRKAGFTVLTAETMRNISRRTGQTRFVVDGQIVDITGFRP